MAQLDFPEFGEMSHNHCQPHCTAQLHSPAHLSHSRFTGIPGRTRSFSSFRQTQLVVHCADENINTECIDPSGCLLDILTGQCDRHVGKSRLGKRIRWPRREQRRFSHFTLLPGQTTQLHPHCTETQCGAITIGHASQAGELTHLDVPRRQTRRWRGSWNRPPCRRWCHCGRSCVHSWLTWSAASWLGGSAVNCDAEEIILNSELETIFLNSLRTRLKITLSIDC